MYMYININTSTVNLGDFARDLYQNNYLGFTEISSRESRASTISVHLSSL